MRQESWTIDKLKNLPIEIIDGDRSNRYPKRNEMVDDGVLFLSTPSIVDGRIDISQSNFITEDKYNEIRKGRIQNDDVVLTTRGTIGKLALFKPAGKYNKGLINAQMLILRADPAKIDPRFLYYLMGSEGYQREMRNFSSGSAQPQIPITDLKETELSIPPIAEQKKIADILSAYDNLIENNNRRIAILEEMAQSLYREWFVKFRFPGHENAKFIDSPLGKIPEGWDAVLFKDVFRTTLGGDWGKDTPDEKNNCEVSVVRGTDFEPLRVGCFSDVPKRYIPEGSLVKRRLEPGDVIVENSVNAKSRCVGRTLLVTKGLLNRIGGDVIAASFCKVFKPMDVAYGHLVHLCMKELWLNGRMSFFNNVAANGIGNFQSKRFLDTEYFLVPAERDKEIIVDTLRACTDSIYADKNNNLAATRDMLLPKLISGKFRIN